jgi:multicomponent Na+:H+ antiporter subunit C
MNLLLSLAIALLFGTGAYLMLKHDLMRMTAGVVLLSNAANLFLMSARLSSGAAPIYPLPEGQTVADPLVQALTLTAIVITFGVAAVLLGLVYRVYTTHQSINIDDLTAAEIQDQPALQRREEEFV